MVRRTTQTENAPTPPPLWGVLVLLLGWFVTAPLHGAEPTTPGETPAGMGLRFAWGGGRAKPWAAKLSLSEGRWTRSADLGRTESLGITTFPNGSDFIVRSRFPQKYIVMDVMAEADPAATVKLQIWESPTTEPIEFTYRLSDLKSQTADRTIFETDRLMVRRTPGDWLRLQTARDHLVFQPNEPWPVDIVANLPPIPDCRSARLSLRMLDQASGREVWQTQRSLAATDGRFTPIHNLDIPIPDREGVFNLLFRMSADTALPMLRPGNEPAEARIQLVVVDSNRSPGRLAPHSDRWRQVISFNPAQPRWWERLPRLPPFPTNLPQLVQFPPEGTGTARTASSVEGRVSRLEAEGWQVYPLPLQHVDQPHAVEIELPGSGQSLGVSVMDVGPDGKLAPNASSAGFFTVPAESGLNDGPSSPSASPPVRQRVVFWPKSRSPVLVLTNLQSDRAADFGEIRVHTIRQLPPFPQGGRLAASANRKAYAHVGYADFYRSLTPSFAEDDGPVGGITDWQTFLTSSERLAALVRHAGYQGVSLTASGSAGCLYPSRVFAPNQSIDSGLLHPRGGDLFSKDVIELLLRVFDKHGLELMVGIDFSQPIPELERIRNANPPGVAAGIELVDARGVPWSSTSTEQPRAIYNPVDPRVQLVMVKAVRELAERYSRHRSFGGVRLSMSPQTSTQLPGEMWGADPNSVAQCRAELKRGDQTLPTVDWLEWRCRRLTNLYAQMTATVTRIRPDARVILDSRGLAELPPLRAACQPTLPPQVTIHQAFRQMGLAHDQLSQIPGLVFLKPMWERPMASIARQGAIEDACDRECWRSLEQRHPGAVANTTTATTFSRQTARAWLPSVDGLEFGGGGPGVSIPVLTQNSGPAACRSFAVAMATYDSLLIVDGGGALSHGIDESSRDFLVTYSQLPREPFALQDLPGGDPLTLRTLVKNGRTYFYLINRSPWPVRADLSLAGPTGLRMSAWGSFEQTLQPVGEGKFDYAAELPPFSMAAGYWNDEQCRPLQLAATLPTGVRAGLQQRFNAVAKRAGSVRQPRPFDVLRNPDFESPADVMQVPGWDWSREPGVSVRVIPASGQQVGESNPPENRTGVLQLQSNGPAAWVRSQPFAAPDTGRLSVQAAVRIGESRTHGQRHATSTAVGQRLPTVRLAIEGVLDGKPYYRYADIRPPANPTGGRTTDSSVGSSPMPANGPVWVPFVLHIADLPASGLQKLRVRFDLMGAGTVAIDNVRLFDLSLTPEEHGEISKLVGLADLQLRDENFGGCHHTLSRYWPQYLLQTIRDESPTARLASVPQTDPPGTGTPEPPPPPTEESEGKVDLLDSMRRLLPKLR